MIIRCNVFGVAKETRKISTYYSESRQLQSAGRSLVAVFLAYSLAIRSGDRLLAGCKLARSKCGRRRRRERAAACLLCLAYSALCVAIATCIIATQHNAADALSLLPLQNERSDYVATEYQIFIIGKSRTTSPHDWHSYPFPL